MGTVTKWIVAAVVAVAWVGLACAQDLESKNRKEIKRTDLGGTTNMEVILSTTGEFSPRHIHHGVEAFYILQGATVETTNGKQIELATGTGSMNLRDVPHAGFKVLGNTPLKILTVHIVDKGAPLYDATSK